MKDLAKQDALTGFHEGVWYHLVDYITVYDRERGVAHIQRWDDDIGRKVFF